jgi:acyl-CoA synthetase (AMP-forming)/AMP-acid ligase II
VTILIHQPIIMSSSSPKSRLAKLAAHFLPASASPQVPDAPNAHTIDGHAQGTSSWFNHHTLSPAFFLPRAAQIEPDAPAIYHRTKNGKILRRSYIEFADRARGFAYYVKKKGYRRTGILATNTPAFLEAIYGIGAAGGINIAINYRLKADDISYIFDHADADSIIVDAEFLPLLDDFRTTHPNVAIIIDTDTDATQGQLSGPFDDAVLEGLKYDIELGSKGWDGLVAQAPNELDINALAYTSGTTARPKGVEYTHRSCYLAALGNVIESGLSYHGTERARYLWTLPMFHAMGWTFPWAVTAARGTHYCLRKIDYPEIWRLLKEEKITHYCAAPTVNTLLCADSNAEKLEQPVRVTVAASPPTAHLFQTMEELNLHPVHVYGLTETYGPITKGYHMLSWSDLEPKERYAKMARQGHGFVTSLPCRVVNSEKAEKGIIEDVKKDGKEIGEIVFDGNICARGYYKDKDATAKLFKGGVLHSGDLAVWWPDGAIHILDRAKDIIISGKSSVFSFPYSSCPICHHTTTNTYLPGGENISSVALESIIVTHPDILECGVAAVNDSHWGERPKAFITVKKGKELKNEDVVQWCKEHKAISRFMVPREVEVVDELPKTSTGKIRKNVLRQWAKGGEKNME